jgi:hypothetical protein
MPTYTCSVAVTPSYTCTVSVSVDIIAVAAPDAILDAEGIPILDEFDEMIIDGGT